VVPRVFTPSYEDLYEDFSEDFSDGFSNEELPYKQTENFELSEAYTNMEEGFSFRYPSSWEHLSETDFAIRKEMVGDGLILEIYSLDDLEYGESYYASFMQVLKGPVNLAFEGTIEDFQRDMSASTAVNSIIGEALMRLIMYNTLPDGRIANDLYGKVDGLYDRFALCDIDQDGEKELLVNISSGSEASNQTSIYKINSGRTGLEYVWSFSTGASFYETGFVKEKWSHNQGLADNFWPYSIYQRTDGGYSEIGGADAWEKTYWEYDFSGNPFPEEVDVDGNGIVYFISDGNGIDYDNPVDDAAYKEFEKSFFGNLDELYVPWQSLELDKVKAATGIEGTGDIYEEAGGGDLCYGDVPLLGLLNKSKDEVCNAFGFPASGTPVNGELLFGGTEYYSYTGLVLYFDNRTDTVAAISVRPGLVKLSGLHRIISSPISL